VAPRTHARPRTAPGHPRWRTPTLSWPSALLLTAKRQSAAADGLSEFSLAPGPDRAKTEAVFNRGINHVSHDFSVKRYCGAGDERAGVPPTIHAGLYARPRRDHDAHPDAPFQTVVRRRSGQLAAGVVRTR